MIHQSSLYPDDTVRCGSSDETFPEPGFRRGSNPRFSLRRYVTRAISFSREDYRKVWKGILSVKSDVRKTDQNFNVMKRNMTQMSGRVHTQTKELDKYVVWLGFGNAHRMCCADYRSFHAQTDSMYKIWTQSRCLLLLQCSLLKTVLMQLNTPINCIVISSWLVLNPQNLFLLSTLPMSNRLYTLFYIYLCCSLVKLVCCHYGSRNMHLICYYIQSLPVTHGTTQQTNKQRTISPFMQCSYIYSQILSC